MSHRKILGLLWAKEAVAKPSFARKSRARGAKALGLRYEAALARRLPGAQHGKWFEFQDANGLGWCQPDLFVQIESENCVLVLECKHTWTAEGHSQLEQLYFPVLEKVFGQKVVGVQVCKYLAPGVRDVNVVSSLETAFELAIAGRRVAWHWIGGSPVLPPKAGFARSHLASVSHLA